MMIFSFIIIFFAALLHGLTGMGFPLISTPALAFTMPLISAIAMLAIPTLIINALVVFGKGNVQSNNTSANQLPWHHYLRQYWLLAGMSVIGSIVGVKLLFLLPIHYISLVMALVIFYYAGHGLLSSLGKVRPLKVATGQISMAIFGFASGLIGGATNAMSPILMMYLFSKSSNKDEIAKASNLCYLLAKLVQITMLWSEFRHFSNAQWQLLIGITLIASIALWLGMRVRACISQNLFKNLIYFVLLGLALKIGHGAILAL